MACSPRISSGASHLREQGQQREAVCVTAEQRCKCIWVASPARLLTLDVAASPSADRQLLVRLPHLGLVTLTELNSAVSSIALLNPKSVTWKRRAEQRLGNSAKLPCMHAACGMQPGRQTATLHTGMPLFASCRPQAGWAI